MDEGEDSIWCNIASEMGNYWKDWNKRGSYKLDGKANSVDQYPLDNPLVHELNPTETTSKLKLNLRTILSSLILFVIILKKQETVWEIVVQLKENELIETKI